MLPDAPYTVFAAAHHDVGQVVGLPDHLQPGPLIGKLQAEFFLLIVLLRRPGLIFTLICDCGY
jgi:hypothetical protein